MSLNRQPGHYHKIPEKKRTELLKRLVLATDLDGTFLPLAGNTQNELDLRTLETELRASNLKLVYVTGRHFASVSSVMDQLALPAADWIVCDVGTSIYARSPGGDSAKSSEAYELSPDYREHLGQIVGDFDVDRLATVLEVVTQLRRQEAEKQSRFKLSYYVDFEQMAPALEMIEQLLALNQAPYSVIASQDPFTADGLIDFLPRNVSKAYALQWWSEQFAFPRTSIMFAGDSGNDSAAFAAGYPSIVVANAAAEVLEHARRAHAAAGWSERLFAAPAPATSGVLAGLRHFLSQKGIPD